MVSDYLFGMATLEKPRWKSTKNWLNVLLVLTFLSLVLSVWISGFAYNICRKERYRLETRLRSCEFSVTMAQHSMIFPLERAKSSRKHLEIGFLLDDLGRRAEAGLAFERAIQDANAYRSYSPDWLTKLSPQQLEWLGNYSENVPLEAKETRQMRGKHLSLNQ
jgi:hypothetical protein